MISRTKLLAYTIACVLCGVGAADAAAAKKQSALQSGTTVRSKVEANGLYDQECYDAYYGCMDQFCITENTNGGSCACSDLSSEYEKQYAEIKKTMEEAERVSTVEVEKVKAGAQADIIFGGERKYDEDGNVLGLGEVDAKTKKKQERMALWSKTFDDDEDDDVFGYSSVEDFANKTGEDLRRAAEGLCLEQIPSSCDKDVQFLRQVYARQIKADCNAFANVIAKQKAEADLAMANAEADVRAALKESFDAANKYDRGTCMVEYKKCMLTDDACGKDWINCVSIVAQENMQNNKAVSTADTKVETVDTYGITPSTLESLESKRYICEKVLDQCVAVRSMVWSDFLREAAPTIKVAESKAESSFRQSCLINISNCIQTACKDDIVGKGTATMDACLSRPDMARSFCKVEIDPCERMEPLIWGYVVDKLAAMRVDACTQEVKDCFTADTRCGKDFVNCIGMDYNYIHDICPIDSLVVCKANNPAFSMDDLDSMLMGLYLNIDNAALDQCQDLVDQKMAELCGSTTDCNKFAADDTIGTGSIRSQKDGDVYRVTGMISFGSIKMGDATGTTRDNGEDSSKKLKPGEIGVQEYIAKVRQTNAGIKNADGIIASIEEELNNIAGTINRTIQIVEQDPEIQFCINGRDLSQITGKKNDKTAARFPNLLTQTKMVIAAAAIRKAQDNYNNKLNEEIANATKNASIDIAQYMCQMMPMNGGAKMSDGSESTPLTPPYAISYDVGTGLNSALLAQGGHDASSISGTAKLENSANKNATKGSEGIATVLTLGLNQMMGANNHVSVELPSGRREMWSVFNREARTCHYCTSTVTKNCNSVSKKGFLGIGATNELNCAESDPVEKCEDIPM